MDRVSGRKVRRLRARGELSKLTRPNKSTKPTKPNNSNRFYVTITEESRNTRYLNHLSQFVSSDAYGQAIYAENIRSYLINLHSGRGIETIIKGVKCPSCGGFHDSETKIVVEKQDGYYRCPAYLMGQCTGDCEWDHMPINNIEISKMCYLTKRPVPLLNPDTWAIIIKLLEHDKSHSTVISDLYVFGRAAYTAVQRYVQSIFKTVPYPFTTHSLKCGKTRITVERLAKIVKGRPTNGRTAIVTIDHPELPAPVRKIVSFDRFIFTDTKAELVFIIDQTGILYSKPFSQVPERIRDSTEVLSV
jgi:hypothetical protein